MTVTQALASFALIAVLLTLTPGLDTALVLRTSISRGRTHGWAAALGIGAGCLVWGIAAAVGASALLAASTTAYRVLTLTGALYLVGFGVRLLWVSVRRRPADAGNWSVPARPAGSAWSMLAAGAGTNLLNPKVAVFYVATIPQFIPAGAAPLLMGVALAVVHVLIGLVWFALLITGTHHASRWLGARSITRVTDRVTGIVLIGFGARLALDGVR